jgi:hypothetical protein
VPIAQITCRKKKETKSASQLGLTTASSSSTSHRPRIAMKRPSSPLDRLEVSRWSQALVPARKTNTGAQKWVIQRVRNRAGVAWSRSSGRNAVGE